MDLLKELAFAEFQSPVHDPQRCKAATHAELQYLSSAALRFPVKNKAKTINANIVNFEFENGVATSNPIKQEVFLLEFDLAKLLGAADAAQVIPVDYDMNQKSLMFIINVSPLSV